MMITSRRLANLLVATMALSLAVDAASQGVVGSSLSQSRVNFIRDVVVRPMHWYRRQLQIQEETQQYSRHTQEDITIAPVQAPAVEPVSAPVYAPISAPVSAPISAPVASAPDEEGEATKEMETPAEAPVSVPVPATLEVPMPTAAEEEESVEEESLETICAEKLGGVMLDDSRCKLCSEDGEGCCAISLLDFTFTCEVCETIGEEAECIDVDCRLNTEEGGYRCNGCGEYSSGEACLDFECIGEGEDQKCICNSIKWDGKDCGVCTIGDIGSPSFDCSEFGGLDNRERNCNAVNDYEECVRETCALMPSGKLGCDGCIEYTNSKSFDDGEACFEFECSGDNWATECICTDVRWNEVSCGECAVDSDGSPLFDCRGVGGPKRPPDEESSPASSSNRQYALSLHCAFLQLLFAAGLLSTVSKSI